METVADVVRRLWALCGVLRDDGISYHEYLGELSSLLFLKMADELGLANTLDDRLSWSRLSTSPDDELLERYNHALSAAASSSDDRLSAMFEGARTQIRSGHALRRLVDGLSEVSWYRGTGAVGDIYEGLIEKNATESRYGAGQYFTPRALVDALVSVMSPQPDDIIYDPAAGTAGFLVAAATKGSAQSANPPTLLGRELVQSVQRLALMNVYLHGFSAEVTHGDALSVDPTTVAATLCLSNPPFGVRGGLAPDQQALLPYPTSNKQLAFLQHIYLSLAPGGRAAVVLPDNALFESGVASHIRRELLNGFDVHTVLRLPAGIFYATGVKTCVLFFSRTRATSEVWTYDLRSATTPFTKRRQVQPSDLEDFRRAFGDDPHGRAPRTESEHFYVTRREDLIDLGETLDIPRPHEEEKERVSTEAVLDLLIEELHSAVSAINGIAELVRTPSREEGQ